MTDGLLTLRQVLFFWNREGFIVGSSKKNVWLILKTLNSQMDFREEFLKQILR